MNRSRFILSLVVLVGLCGCGGSTEEEFPLPERFEWREQPIRFSPAPDTWSREKTTSGGLFGVRFVKTKSVGEGITVAEVYRFGDRDRCREIDALVARCDEWSWRDLVTAVNKAQIDVRHPVNDVEEYLGGQANAAMNRAVDALRQDDPSGACRQLELAREQVGRIVFTIDDVPEKRLAVFTTGDQVPADRFRLVGTSRTEVAGLPAHRRDYTFSHRGHLFIGRELFVMHNNRLFVAAFHGLESNLPLFENMVASIAFPPGECVH